MGLDGEVVYKIRGDDSEFSKDLDGANEKAKKSGGIMEKLGIKASTVAKTGAVAIGAAVYKFGTDFEQTFANASTMFGDVSVDADGLKNKILDMSDATGVAASEYNNGLYQALSAGIPVTEDMSEATGFLEKNAKLSKAGFTDLSSAIDVSTSILNSYHMSVEDTDRVHKVLMQTQNKGKTTIAELSSSISNVVPTASAMNVSFEQVGASLATMTAQGIPTAQATTQLNQLLAELGKTGTKANTAFMEATQGTKYAGKSFQDLMQEGVPLSDVLTLINKNAQANGQSLLDMFSSIDAGKGALTMAGENAQLFNDNLAAMSTQTDVVGDAFDKVTNTTGAKVGEMLNQLKNFAIQIFDAISPVICDILPMLSSILGEIIPPIMQIVEEIMPPLQELLQALMPLISAVMDVLKPILELVIQILQPILDIIVNALTPLIEICVRVIEIALKPLKAYIGILGEYAKSILGGVASYIGDQFNRILDIFNNIIGFIKNVFTGNWKAAWENIKNIFGDIFKGIVALCKMPINLIIDGLNGFIKGLNKIKIPDWVPGVGGKGIHIGTIPRLKAGIDYVPGDMKPYYLDSGEAVLTQSENARYRKLGGIDNIEKMLSKPSSSQNQTIVINVASPDINLDGQLISNSTTQHQATDVLVRRTR